MDVRGLDWPVPCIWLQGIMEVCIMLLVCCVVAVCCMPSVVVGQCLWKYVLCKDFVVMCHALCHVSCVICHMSCHASCVM